MTAPATTAKLWRVRDAARYYGETGRTIRNWIDKGAIEAVKIGGCIRIVPPAPTATGGRLGAR